ncbi:MAG: MmgE/PrpD family protein, partial [Solirubrobacterales bacterium]|nr:MmgE/PrpD family protein [Solirubrobacterales bacterium]
SSVAHALAAWATELNPSEEDLALARRSLLDTAAVMVAARDDPVAPQFSRLSEAGCWAALAHVLDYDDLHMPSTTHISAVCAPVALAASRAGGPDPARGGPDPAPGGPDPARGGPDPARAYLAGAGVMARLGTALGWRHYRAGWHATCTAGAPAAAVTAATARGLDATRTAIAIALAIPAAGGVQRAFGTAAKALQVGFAAEAGMRAAALAEAGASADIGAVEDWMTLVGGDPGALAETARLGGLDATSAVPDGLAIKLYPCCYALQRPISAAVELYPVAVDRVRRVTVRTPACALAPLIHSRPGTGLEGKFSLEYGIAAALLDGRPGIESFRDEAVARPEAIRLTEMVEVVPGEGGDHLLAGTMDLEIGLDDGTDMRAELATPPGAPDRPPTDEELRAKLELCAGSEADRLAALTWDTAAAYLRSRLAD